MLSLPAATSSATSLDHAQATSSQCVFGQAETDAAISEPLEAYHKLISNRLLGFRTVIDEIKRTDSFQKKQQLNYFPCA